jgi:hypothetical protein
MLSKDPPARPLGYAETVIEALEDAQDYHAFEAAVTADYDAQTAVERELVLRLASLLWRLRRATAMETGLFDTVAAPSDRESTPTPPQSASGATVIAADFGRSDRDPVDRKRGLRDVAAHADSPVRRKSPMMGEGKLEDGLAPGLARALNYPTYMEFKVVAEGTPTPDLNERYWQAVLRLYAKAGIDWERASAEEKYDALCELLRGLPEEWFERVPHLQVLFPGIAFGPESSGQINVPSEGEPIT